VHIIGGWYAICHHFCFCHHSVEVSKNTSPAALPVAFNVLDCTTGTNKASSVAMANAAVNAIATTQEIILAHDFAPNFTTGNMTLELCHHLNT